MMTSQKFLWKAAAMGEAFLLPLPPFLCKNRLFLSLPLSLSLFPSPSLDANTRVEGGTANDENSP